MKITNNYTLQSLRKILSDNYGIHVKTAIQNLDLDLLGDDDELDAAAFTAYSRLYMLESRTLKVVGISKTSFSILSLVVMTIYDIVLSKLLIPSIGMNYALRYSLGYEISRLMFRDEQSSSECIALLIELAIVFSNPEFADHLKDFEKEGSKNGYHESSWYFSEFHDETDSNPFIIGCFHGHSGNSKEQIEISNIVESMNTQDGE